MAAKRLERKSYSLVIRAPKAIVIHCSDPRFQRAFTHFVKDDLRLRDGEFIPIVISGGAAPLSEPQRLPEEFKFVKNRMDLFLRRFESLSRLVLINHEDCRHYESLHASQGRAFLGSAGSMGERQRTDLRDIAQRLPELAKRGISFEQYFARLEGAGRRRVVFEKI